MSVDITSLTTMITSSVALILAFYIFFKDLADIKSRLIALETKITPFWNWVDKNLPAILHSPHTPEFDELLDKYQQNRDLMSLEELEKLKCILKDEMRKTAKEKILLYVLMLSGLDAYMKNRLGSWDK